MRKERLTMMGHLTLDRGIFAMRKSPAPVKCQSSNVNRSTNGFTLVEMTVSIGLFIIIMFIATSAFLSIVNTDRKARAVRIASDNLNIALEDMQRRIKTGMAYYSGDSPTLGAVNDSVWAPPTPATAFSFDYQSDAQSAVVRTTYKLAQGTLCASTGFTAAQGCILRNGSLATSPEINITQLDFLVSGSAPCGTTPPTPCTNTQQPKVVILINGTVGTGAVATSFNIQTTVTQRAYDN